MKQILGVLAVSILLISACGGSDATNPAAFGDESNKDTAPANDMFTRAEAISRVAFNKTATNRAATLETGEPQSCASIDHTVWYQFTPKSDVNLKAKASASFATVVAVYSGSDMTALTEVGCAATGPTTELQFGALAGETYNIQIGSADGGEGTVSFGMSDANQAQLLLGDPGPLLPGWTEKVLLEETPVVTPAVGPIDVDLVTIDGAPQAANPKLYDITITAAGQPLPTITMNSRGLLTEPIHVELVQITKEATAAAVQLSYRFDPRRTSCELGVGGVCVVRVPVDPTDLDWTTQSGPSAELIIMAKLDVGDADINGVAPDVDVPSPLYIRIPLVGQVTAILP
jgi:hypothetical protein